MPSALTVTDQFCGAGGSAIGVEHAGAHVRMAINHWPLAVATHAANFPHTDHDCADLSACDPRRYPRTDMLITSPECTHHSSANGVQRRRAQRSLFGDRPADPAAERSRATMWDVPRFAEYHQYAAIIVENVVEVRHWLLWTTWLTAMQVLGYDHRCLYLNSMHFPPTPQSRDRVYVVFWRHGHPAPRLDYTPTAWCPACERTVAAVQSWKNPLKPAGKYRQQYVYCCPTCAAVVEPEYTAAWTLIDWSLPAPRIGDRPRPLKDTTLARIQTGLEKFGPQHLLVRNYSPGYSAPITGPCGAITTVDHHSLVTVPPFVTAYYGTDTGHHLAAPLGTVVTRDRHALVMPPPGLPAVHDCGFRMLQPHEIGTAMAFPPDYIVYGTKGQQVKQYGGAVTPPVMAWLVGQLTATFN